MMNEHKQSRRRKKIIDTMKAGEVPTPQSLEVSRTTLWRDLKALQEQAVLSLDADGLKAIKQQQYQVQLRMEQALLEGVLDPQTVTAWNKVRESIAKLLGLNAESRAVVAHVTGAQLDSLYLDIRVILQDLDRADQEAALALMSDFAKSRKKPVVVDAMILRSADNVELS